MFNVGLLYIYKYNVYIYYIRIYIYMCMYIYIYMFFVVPMFCFLLVSHYNLCNELQFPTCEACLAISCLQSCVETFFEMTTRV